MTMLNLLTGPWAITPGKLVELQSIYATHLRGEQVDLAALEAKLGRPLANDKQQYTIERGGIAVLSLSGVMAPKANLFSSISGGISTQKATIQLESAMLDPRVRAIILQLDTPGGNVIGTPEFGQAIYQMAKTKPIVAFSDGCMCSAGYWAGSAANAIYISSAIVEVGSIGVVHTRSYDPTSTRVEEKITAGRYKKLSSPTEPYSQESRAVIQDDVNYVYSLFVDTVAKFRGVDSELVLQNMADGRVFRGQKAIDAGLVDAMSTLDDLIDLLSANPEDFNFKNRRKAVFALDKPTDVPPKKPTPPPKKEPAMSNQNQSAALTRASFEQENAPLFAQIRAEFVSLGASQERDRIKAVMAVGDGLPGHEKLLTALAYDGKTSAAEAAVAVLSAEKELRAAALKGHKDDAPPAANPSQAPTDPGEKTKEQKVIAAQAFAKEKGIDFVTALKELGYAS